MKKLISILLSFTVCLGNVDAFRIVATSRTFRQQTVLALKSFDYSNLPTTTTSSITNNAHFVSATIPKINNDFIPAFTAILKPLQILQLGAVYVALKVLPQQIYKCQSVVQRCFSMGQPKEWDRSIFGFLTAKGELLNKIMVLSYMFGLATSVLSTTGVIGRPGLAILLSRIVYSLYATHVIDQFCSRFLPVLVPNLVENRRQRYLVGRAISVCLWAIQLYALGEMVSTFLNVPLKTVLAAGGVGGLVLGLSARDIAANLLGGLTLLVNEPFTPGDFVSFKTGGSELVGRVESVGWGQTCVRCKDTRPVYVPNAHFVGASVTNLERITHRKFETTIQLRHQDFSVITEVVTRMRERMRSVAKLDPASMPFRVSFARVGPHSLDVEVLAYFATRSLDEFTMLQQAANIELMAAVEQCGAKLALPSSIMHLGSSAQLSGAS